MLWYENFVETHRFRKASAEFLKIFHTGKLGITLLYAVKVIEFKYRIQVVFPKRGIKGIMQKFFHNKDANVLLRMFCNDY